MWSLLTQNGSSASVRIQQAHLLFKPFAYASTNFHNNLFFMMAIWNMWALLATNCDLII